MGAVGLGPKGPGHELAQSHHVRHGALWPRAGRTPPKPRPAPKHRPSPNPAYTQVGSWLYKSLLGVTPLLPGYAKAAVLPSGVLCAGCNLTAASGTLATPHGPLTVRWAKGAAETAAVNLSVSIPLGANATVGIPFGCGEASTATIAEGGAVVWRSGHFIPGAAPGVSAAAAVPGPEPRVEFEVASGDYAFATSCA